MHSLMLFLDYKKLLRIGAVSYTHLDVYKRQGFRFVPVSSGEASSLFGKLLQTGEISPAETVKLPVSYTHLDVYKRQAYPGGCGSGRGKI